MLMGGLNWEFLGKGSCLEFQSDMSALRSDLSISAGGMMCVDTFL